MVFWVQLYQWGDAIDVWGTEKLNINLDAKNITELESQMLQIRRQIVWFSKKYVTRNSIWIGNIKPPQNQVQIMASTQWTQPSKY